MRLLLGSGGFRTPERLALLTEEMRSFFGSVDRILFVPYALADYDGYLERIAARRLDAGLTLEGIHRAREPVQAVEEAAAIYIGGGNSFRLLDKLYELGLLEVIRRRVRTGMPYMGVSAGSNMACPTLMTTNDMPIVQPPGFEALGLVSFQINPHYFSGQIYVRAGDGFQQHFGETRDDRIAEYHEVNDLPVIGLREGGILRVEEGRYRLVGAPARLFQKGREAVDIEPGQPIWPVPEALP
jgi:dipeptidase E